MTTATTTHCVTYTLSDRIVPKARPRLGKNGNAANPARYSAWKFDATYELMEQHRKLVASNQFVHTVFPVSIHIDSTGSAFGDSDNIVGSIFDALVNAYVLPNDTLKHIDCFHYQFHHNTKVTHTTISILNTPLIFPYSDKVATFTFPDRIIPKARPRIGDNGHIYMPPHYAEWKKKHSLELAMQYYNRNLSRKWIYPLSLALDYHGSYVGDSDNIFGSVLDALVDGEVIANDNLKRINSIFFNFTPATDHFSTLTFH
jgi:Holliday junction resolvase RusA-like endonuclease